MKKHEKTLSDILSEKKDNHIRFSDLQGLLEYLGLNLERVSGSHHIYSLEGVLELIDIQPDKKDHSKAKRYQVKQVRSFIKRHLGEQ